MPHPIRRGALAALLTLLASTVSAGQITLSTPGNVERCVAFAAGGEGRETRGECGAPMTVDNPRTAWIETDTRISSQVLVTSEDQELSLEATFPAAVITFSEDEDLRPGESLLVLSSPGSRDGRANMMITRVVTDTRAEVRVPAGPIVIVHRDSKGRFVGIRTGVASAGVRPVRWARTERSGILVADLSRPRPAVLASDDRVTLTYANETGEVPPAATLDVSDRIMAVWTGVGAGAGRVIAQSPALRLPNDEVSVARNTVTVLKLPLRTKPSLTITIDDIAGRDKPGKMQLTLAAAAAPEKAVRQSELSPGQTITFESLDADLYRASLDVGGFMVTSVADLRSGEDAATTIELAPLLIEGTVFLGDRATPATIELEQAQKPLRFSTDDKGRFSTVLWKAGRYFVNVFVEGQSTPFKELLTIRTSTRLDIRVPHNVIRARVFDRDTGELLREGEARIHSRWQGPKGSQSSVTSVPLTGREVEFAPQRPGSITVSVRAPGYEYEELPSFTLDESTRERRVEIAMRSRAERREWVILLPGGNAAAGAELASAAGEPQWRAKADSSGRVQVPQDPVPARVIVRHPQAASEVVVPSQLHATESITLKPAAAPLLIEVVDRTGTRLSGSPAWLTAVEPRLTSSDLAFATWSHGATGPDGTVMLSGLPQRAIRLVATRVPQETGGGAYNALSRVILYPWPSRTQLTVAD